MAAPPANLKQLAVQAARRYGVPTKVFLRQINLESGFNPNAKSGAGAEGIAQFMPSTAKSEGVNPYDPRSALFGAARLDAKLVKQTGSFRNALAAYNAGPGNIPAGLGYADSILQGSAPAPNVVRADGTGSGNVGKVTTKTVPGVDNSAQRRTILLNYLLNGGKDTSGSGLLNAVTQISQIKDTPAKTVTVPGSTKAAAPQSIATPSVKGAVNIDGKPVSGWIAGILKQARAAGWKGTVTSGIRTRAEQAVLYQRYLAGGNIAAKPGQSNHESGNAIDVTDPAGLNATLQKLGITKLKWAVTHGLADQPHFSSTGN